MGLHECELIYGLLHNSAHVDGHRDDCMNLTGSTDYCTKDDGSYFPPVSLASDSSSPSAIAIEVRYGACYLKHCSLEKRTIPDYRRTSSAAGNAKTLCLGDSVYLEVRIRLEPIPLSANFHSTGFAQPVDPASKKA